jgi:uncharacterized protein GlcG (DUF336 family)
MSASKGLLAALATVVMLGVPVNAGAQVPERLTLDEALRMIDTAQKEAAARNVSVSIAVVDGRGDLIAIVRMAGAGANTADTAIGKAMMSALYGQPSAALVSRSASAPTQALNEATGGRLRFVQGGVPVIKAGYILGGIAASGAAPAVDEAVSEAGLAILRP